MSPANKTKPLIAYLRQSRTKERSISLKEQREAIERWAEVHKEKVVFDDRYVERSVSGAKPWQERELGAVIETLQKGVASGLIVAYQDRLARPTWLQEAEVWDALAAADGRLVCAAEGTDFRPGDEEASDARMLYRIKGATARHQWERHCRNWKKGKHHAWEAGKYVADPPAGYDRIKDGGLIPNKHAEAIREAFRVKADGGTWLAVANVLTAGQVPTSGGHGKKGTTRWSREGVRSVMLRQTYYGLHACTCGCDEEVIRPEWDILTRPEQEPGAGKRLWKKAQPSGETTVRHRGEGHALGGGLIRCSTCGLGLIRSSTKGGKYHQMRCPGRGNGHPSITFQVALEHILHAATERWGGFNYTREQGSNAAEVEAAEARLTQARAELAEVEEMLGTKAPEGSRQRIAVEEAEDTLAGLDRTEGDTRLYVMSPYQMRDTFDVMSPPEQRKALRALEIERVILSPGRGTVADRLRIEFSDGTVWSDVKARLDAEEAQRSAEEWAAFQKAEPEGAAEAEAALKELTGA
jgi:DNA invertase Pin-like site-specific DNA recombinase